jgi:hypothetical protein
VDAAEVRVAHVAHAGRHGGELDERLVVVGARVELGELRGLDGAWRVDVAGDELALVDRQQVRDERARHVGAEHGELLVDLRRVAVLADVVGVDVLVDGDEVRLGRRAAPAPGDAGLRVDDRRRRSGPARPSGASARIARSESSRGSRRCARRAARRGSSSGRP